ncbi:MAG: hypothetical protein BWY43_00028 [candidate division WS2 bacterium ADurb.Bin280]|uniref:Uncharacterized protein n=1 Tax=candidate division WS2 bacterium ADurb.Bin280 TaxID=1852829 RepID=A0A1V5SFV9_9BACT|nr:MAG: hypothetical protein BWY43_00028 [candidate division WS2 bacterium ADurb.Bin280]
MRKGLWAPFDVRIIEPGDVPADDELVITSQIVGMDLDEIDLEISTPPIVPVIRAMKYGSMPSRFAVEDMSAQTTSALAVALGIRLADRICTAAIMYDCVGPDAVESDLRIMIEGYYGYREDVTAKERQRMTPREDRILRRMVCYWRRIVNDKEKVRKFASIGREYEEQIRLGVTNTYVDECGMFCVVEAELWAFPVGFCHKGMETVVLIQADDWGCEKLSIGSIAPDLSFMKKIHAKLSQAERAVRVKRGISARMCGWRISEDGAYIIPPKKKKGTVLSLKRILRIVRSCLSQ